MSVWKAILITIGILLGQQLLLFLLGLFCPAIGFEIATIISWCLSLGLIVGSAIWAYADASKLQTYRYKGINGAGMQCAGMLLLWIVAFPWYLVSRSRILNGTAILEDKYGEWYYMSEGNRNGPVNIIQLVERIGSIKPFRAKGPSNGARHLGTSVRALRSAPRSR